MPILILILSAVGGAIWWWIKSNPREALDAAKDIAVVAKNAPRKLAFRKQLKAHPVEGIDDWRIAVCAIGQAFIELEDLPTKGQRDRLHLLLRTKLRCTEEEAQEMEVLGRWLMTQCNGAALAVPRLGRRLHKIDGDASWARLTDFLMDLVEGDLSASQTHAIEDLRLAFRK